MEGAAKSAVSEALRVSEAIIKLNLVIRSYLLILVGIEFNRIDLNPKI